MNFAALVRTLFSEDLDQEHTITARDVLGFARISRTFQNTTGDVARIDVGTLAVVLRRSELPSFFPFEDDEELLRYAAENGYFGDESP
jgi:hypothetical protein